MSLSLRKLGTRIVSVAKFRSDWEGFDHDREMRHCIFTLSGLAIEGSIIEFDDRGEFIHLTFSCHRSQYQKLEAAI